MKRDRVAQELQEARRHARGSGSANAGGETRRRGSSSRVLCLGHGASKDILRWITHAPQDDVIDDSTTLVWKALCREVSKLEIELHGSDESVQVAIANSAATRMPPSLKGGPAFAPGPPRSVAHGSVTRPGVLRDVMVPSPSWPSSLFPQQ